MQVTLHSSDYVSEQTRSERVHHNSYESSKVGMVAHNGASASSLNDSTKSSIAHQNDYVNSKKQKNKRNTKYSVDNKVDNNNEKGCNISRKKATDKECFKIRSEVLIF